MFSIMPALVLLLVQAPFLIFHLRLDLQQMCTVEKKCHERGRL